MLTRIFKNHFRRIVSRGTYIPEVDGIRFLAIASVLLFHLYYALRQRLPAEEVAILNETTVSNFLQYGNRGVKLFFVLSGFILALPFIADHRGKNSVNLKRYFLRRLTRLEPPYVICLLLFFLAAAILQPGIENSLDRLLIRLLYAYKLYYEQHPKLNGVTWTLEIEVQFYLLVPLFASIFHLSHNLRRSLLALIVLAFSVLEFETWWAHHSVINYLEYFLVGFLLADFYKKWTVSNKDRQIKTDFLGLSVIVTMILVACKSPYWFEIALPAAAALFFWCVLTGKVFRKLFSLTPFCLVGGMCYSIYLMHFPIMSFLADRLVFISSSNLDPLWKYLIFSGIALPLVVFVSTIFYLLIERPCMDPMWPRKLLRKLFPSRPVVAD